MKRIVGKRFAISLGSRERQEIDQPVGDVIGPGEASRQPIANDLAACIADRFELVLDVVAEMSQAIGVERVTNAERVCRAPC